MGTVGPAFHRKRKPQIDELRSGTFPSQVASVAIEVQCSGYVQAGVSEKTQATN